MLASSAVIDSTIPQDSSALGLKTKALRKCKRLKQCIDLHCIERAYCISMGKLCWNYNGVSGSWGKDPACTASCKQPSIPGSLGLPSIDFHPGGHSVQIQSLLGRTRTNVQNEKAAANAAAKKQKQDAAQAEEWAASKQLVHPRAKEWKFSSVRAKEWPSADQRGAVAKSTGKLRTAWRQKETNALGSL